jgi:hypothetical protein
MQVKNFLKKMLTRVISYDKYILNNERNNKGDRKMKKMVGGSEKQIAWAEKIRSEAIEFNNAMYDMEDEEDVQELADEVNEKLEWYANMTPFGNKIENIVEKKTALLRKLNVKEVSEAWENFIESATATEWISYRDNSIEEILTSVFEEKMFKGM